jgi:adenosine deaminase
VEILGVERIEHGVRAIEDPEVVDLLVERGIALGVCPFSNVSLGLYASRKEHPLDALRRAGVRVSVNTDDPASLRTDLVSEYVVTAAAFGWTPDIVRDVARTSVEASFANEDLKRSLLTEMNQEFPS